MEAVVVLVRVHSKLAQQSDAHQTVEALKTVPHISGSGHQIDPCRWPQCKHGLHPPQRTQQTLEGGHIKISLHFDPVPVRQHVGQPATRLLLRQRFPEGQFHCNELPVGGSAFRRLPLPPPLLQVAIQSALTQTSTATKLAPPHPAAHKLRH
jgi:hypothetical protein